MGRTLMFGLRRCAVVGADSIPPDGPVIVAGNHVSYFDPPVLSIALNRPIRFIAKRELFQLPLLGHFLAAIGTFPVDRSRPDVKCVRRAVRVLERGEVLGIFPEGTRNKTPELLPFLYGVGWLAIVTRVPVVPVIIDGYIPMRPGSEWMWPGQLRVVCGAPVTFSPELFPDGRKPHRARASQAIFQQVKALLRSDPMRKPEVAFRVPL